MSLKPNGLTAGAQRSTSITSGSHCGQLTPASSSTLCSRLTSLVRARIIAFRATRQIPQLRNSRVARN